MEAQNGQLSAFVQDVYRFIRNSRAGIELAPLQTYSSSIIFAPMMSKVRRQFIEQVPRYFLKLPLVEESWSGLLQTLEGHSGSVTSVAFSPDSKVEQGLFVSNDWVLEGKEKSLWLPLEYRASSISVWNRIIILRHLSRRISILGFEKGSKHI